MQGSFTRESVTALTLDNAIHPGIAAGKLKKEGIIKYNQLNDLKTSCSMMA